LVSRTLRVHRSPSRVCDDRERPSSGTGWRKYATDLGPVTSIISENRKTAPAANWHDGLATKSCGQSPVVMGPCSRRDDSGMDKCRRRFLPGKSLDSIY